MNYLYIYIEFNGEQKYVGYIEYTSSADARFQYDKDYVYNNYAAPISISLPLQEDPFDTTTTKNFFDGLLPEGFTRQMVSSSITNDANDYISILKHLGDECLGAIMILDEKDSFKPAAYNKLTLHEVKQLAAEGATKSAEIVLNSHLSLAGASGKVGLYYDDNLNEWFQPFGLAPSTHIVKQSNINYKRIVVNEQLCMKTAANLGLDVVDSFIVDTGSKADSNILFATKRFDRSFENSVNATSGLQMPFRLHQEDFSQALSESSLDKYDPNGDYFIRMINVIQKYCSNPIKDILRLFDYTLFNFLIGNTDAHIKNFSLIYDKSLKKICLAPAYDIVSNYCYGNENKDNLQFSFAIGNDKNLKDITVDSFKYVANCVGISDAIIETKFYELANNFEQSLYNASKELTDKGFKDSEKFVEAILNHSYYKLL